MIYYIYMINEDAILADSSGKAREFPKKKKAENFIKGRSHLGSAYRIITDIAEVRRRKRVDY